MRAVICRRLRESPHLPLLYHRFLMMKWVLLLCTDVAGLGAFNIPAFGHWKSSGISSSCNHAHESRTCCNQSTSQSTRSNLSIHYAVRKLYIYVYPKVTFGVQPAGSSSVQTRAASSQYSYTVSCQFPCSSRQRHPLGNGLHHLYSNSAN